jgi:S1-C subfamily serine protease
MNIPEKIRGVIVTDIAPKTPSEGKLMQGDVIQEINRKAIANIETYEAVVSKIKPDEGALLLVFRRGTSIYVMLSP